MEYERAVEWLYGTQLFGIKLGLQNVRRLLDAWRLPDKECRFIHVAGTNGKGSVSALLESILRAEGYRTGLFTSPHLVTYRERMRVNFRMIEEDAVARLLGELKALVEQWDPHPTFFELTTALALKHFKEQSVEVAVLETGLGGRLDATNAVRPVVSVLTPIGRDHEKWLGESLAEIAAEKAGIIKRGVPAVSAPQPAEARDVLLREAARKETELRFVDRPWTESAVGLHGEHQRWNAALAAEALRDAGIAVSGRAVREGLEGVRWRARFQRVALTGGGECVIDGAHNPDAARALVETWREVIGGGRKATVIFGAVSSKDVEGMLRALDPIADRFILVEVRTGRGLDAEVLLSALQGCSSAPGETARGMGEALDFVTSESAGAPILITGSLFLAGEALSHLEEVEFEGSLQ